MRPSATTSRTVSGTELVDSCSSRAIRCARACLGIGLDVLVLDEHRARLGADQARDHAQQRRLARAVGPEQAGQRARRGCRVDAVDHPAPAEPRADALEGQVHADPFPRRSRNAKTGTPTSAVTMPTGSSRGSKTRPRDRVGPDQEHGSGQRGDGQQAAVRRPGQRRDGVRQDQADEPDGPADRDHRAREQGDDDHQGPARAVHVDAERRRGRVAERERVQAGGATSAGPRRSRPPRCPRSRRRSTSSRRASRAAS